MRTYKYFLIHYIIFLFFFAFFVTSIAQEKLPAIVKMIEPSIVVIVTYDKEGEILSQGSGFFISQNGDIITNLHVLQGASHANIKIAQGNVYPITYIVAENNEDDIIRVSVDIPPNFVRPLSINTSIPEVGERIIVIGSPLGLELTVSDGIVSAVRDIPEFGKIIQITAPISSGSSGSPVVNLKGEVIGVATFQFIEGQNLNFAIPCERIIKLKQGNGESLTEWEADMIKEWLDSAKVLYKKGLHFLWIEDHRNALNWFEKAVKKNPNYALAYYRIGYCKYILGRYNECIEAYKQAICINPDFSTAHDGLGIAYSELRRYNESIESFKQSIYINPDNADGHRFLGLAYWGLGRYNECIKSFKQAIRINTDDFIAHHCLGIVYLELDHYHECIKALKQAIRINPYDSSAYYSLGIAYWRLGRYNECIKAFKQAARINPDDATAHYRMGVAYLELDRYYEGIKEFKQAIRINHDYAEAHFLMGVAYFALGDRDSALNKYKILKNLDIDLAKRLFNLIYK
ncbi:MAG: tetratricopeptide repeat protein [Bacteroidales bacterium]|nr:tetratricopeptide repeat protein [Bacteroidales bacterium]